MGSSASLGYFVILKNLSWRAGETRNLGGGGGRRGLKRHMHSDNILQWPWAWKVFIYIWMRRGMGWNNREEWYIEKTMTIMIWWRNKEKKVQKFYPVKKWKSFTLFFLLYGKEKGKWIWFWMSNNCYYITRNWLSNLCGQILMFWSKQISYIKSIIGYLSGQFQCFAL